MAFSTTFHLPKPFLSSPPRLLRLTPRVAWPEWDGFVGKLEEKGFLVEEEEESGSSSPTYYTKVKVASLEFARRRPDILGSLPAEDIKTVVECGCPNLHRKSVNSAKRLRAYLQLDEGDVCSACGLRESCDRAYVVANKDEGARTVDLVRMLLQYAAVSFSIDQEQKQTVNVLVEKSARKLLLELAKLSDSPPDPVVVKETVKTLKTQLKKESPKVSKVRENKPRQSPEKRKGDWNCPECNFMNYARNVSCRQCEADKPKRVGFMSIEMKKGDWTCSKCKFLNFARNTACKQCQESRSKEQLEPGEWECPKCNFLNFRRNRSCLKCKGDRPYDESSQQEDGIWRRPKLSPEADGVLV